VVSEETDEELIIPETGVDNVEDIDVMVEQEEHVTVTMSVDVIVCVVSGLVDAVEIFEDDIVVEHGLVEGCKVDEDASDNEVVLTTVSVA